MAQITVTLEQLQADALLYCDLRPGGANEFIGTTALNRLINQKIRKWQDLLIALRPQDQTVASYTNASFITAGTQEYDIPEDATPPFHSAVSLLLFWTATDPELVPWKPISEIHKYIPLTWGRGSPKCYTLSDGDGNVKLWPSPTISVSATFRYIPAHVDLVASPGSPNTIATVNGWETLVALEVAIDALAIQGRDWSHLKDLRDSERERLQALASERVTIDPKEVRDVYPETGAYRGWPWGLPPP